MSESDMPKGKPYKKPYRKYDKRGYKKKKPSLMFKDANKIIRPEKKWTDQVTTLSCPIGSAFVTTPAQLNPTTGGTGTASGRIGAKISMKSLQLRCNSIMSATLGTSPGPSAVRYVVIYDKQSNAAAPSRSDVFTDGTLWNSPLNLFNQDRFICLVDQIAQQDVIVGQYNCAFECFRKLDMEAVWPSGGTAYPNTGGISLWVSANGDWNDATSAHYPAVQIYSRIRYTDV